MPHEQNAILRSEMRYNHSRGPTRASLWLFATLSTVALLSAPGATHDETYHLPSIWCGHGARDTYCPSTRDIPELFLVAETNFDLPVCKHSPSAPLVCPSDGDGKGGGRVNETLYPRLFYFTLSWFVVPSFEVSVLLIRVVSCLLISVMFGLLLKLLPNQHRVVLILLCITVFPVSGYFLFASVNPSSWAAFGVGVGWLAIHASLVSGSFAFKRSIPLQVIGLTAFVMAGGSRWDAIPFIALSLLFCAFTFLELKMPRFRRVVLLLLAGFAVGLLFVLERFTPLPLLYYLQQLTEFQVGEPDNLAFFSNNLLQALPNALRSLGSVPTMSVIVLPELVYIGSLVLLGAFMITTFNHKSKSQLIGFFVISLGMAVVIMAHAGIYDSRDEGMIEPRYIYPLLIFAVGWWYLRGRTDHLQSVTQYLKAGSIVAVVLFGVTLFTVTERFVDRQTFGIRYLPEGPDQWWWSGIPVGPNVVLVMAVVSMWKFLRQMIEVVEQGLDSETLSRNF